MKEKNIYSAFYSQSDSETSSLISLRITFHTHRYHFICDLILVYFNGLFVLLQILSNKAPECLNYRNASGNTPLHVACRADKQECVKALLVAGADVNISSKPITSANTLSAANIGKVVKDHDSKLHDEVSILRKQVLEKI